MIKGVVIKNLKVHKDIPDTEEVNYAPGILMEVVRSDEGLFKKFGQSTFTVAYQGAIKAFHWHEKQDDLWFVASGQALVVLYDLRADSKTYKQTQFIRCGRDDYKLIVIPVRVAHGYKVLSEEPVMLFYHTTEPYSVSQPDEKRIAWDDPQIGFDWNSFN